MAFFVYKVSGEVMAKFYQNPDLCQNIKSAQISPIQPPGHSLIDITRIPLTVWSHEMNHQKIERATYGDGIRQFESFSFA
jgi:hypothetical protein